MKLLLIAGLGLFPLLGWANDLTYLAKTVYAEATMVLKSDGTGIFETKKPLSLDPRWDISAINYGTMNLNWRELATGDFEIRTPFTTQIYRTFEKQDIVQSPAYPFIFLRKQGSRTKLDSKDRLAGLKYKRNVDGVLEGWVYFKSGKRYEIWLGSPKHLTLTEAGSWDVDSNGNPTLDPDDKNLPVYPFEVVETGRYLLLQWKDSVYDYFEKQ